jgi:hypothetical protein
MTHETHQQKIQIKLSYIANFFQYSVRQTSDSELFNPFLNLKKELPSST